MERERRSARNQRPMKADSLAEVQATAKNMMLENTRISGEVLKGWMPTHHVGQKALMKKFIDDYDESKAPAILVPKVGHTRKSPRGIVSRSTKGIENARQLIARDIKELRKVYPDIPRSKLKELINMNKEMYPAAFTKR